jgi:hypothetical protein
MNVRKGFAASSIASTAEYVAAVLVDGKRWTCSGNQGAAEWGARTFRATR